MPTPSSTPQRTADAASPLPTRYLRPRRIATGGMGSIWAAEDSLLRRPVAVKVLAENLADQAQFVQRFERESRTAASLSAHPNVVTIYDVGEHRGLPLIVMELLPGGTVSDRLASGGAQPEEALPWLRQAASALDYAHEHGVVHRDVKPRNLLFDERGRLVIADFGIARAAYEKSVTVSGELLGTGAYISPEQARGEPATAASDRYALAVVAYELLTGSPPFAGADIVELARQQMTARPRPPSELRPALGGGVDEAVLRGLAKDPAARWPSAGSFVDALDRALTARELPADDPPTQSSPVSRERGLPSFVLPLVVASAALVGLLAAIGLTGGDGGNDQPAARSERSASAERDSGANRSQQPPAQSQPPAGSQPRSESQAPTGAATPAQAAALNDRGFALMNAGRPAEAVPLLERAVSAFGAESRDLTYAYALYNLGRSLRLAGRPDEAIPLLERRLRFANQRETVARELRAARRAAR